MNGTRSFCLKWLKEEGGEEKEAAAANKPKPIITWQQFIGKSVDEELFEQLD